MHGIITKVSNKGFGFIELEDGSTVYFHAKDAKGMPFDRLRKGDKVTIGSIDKVEQGTIAREVQLYLQ